MARPTKNGLDYFPLDVDFFADPKIQFIRAKHGPRGVLAVTQLYCKIYRDGFYILWDEDAVLLFSKYETGIPKNEVNQIINECLDREIFNKNMFEQHGILTSNGIQKRYFEASKKRKFIKGKFAYLLIKLSDYGISSAIISEKTPENVELMQEIGKEGNKTMESIETSETFKTFESEKNDSKFKKVNNELLIPEGLKSHLKYSEFLEAWDRLLQTSKWKTKDNIQLQETLNSFAGFNPMYLKEKISIVISSGYPMVKISKQDFEVWCANNGIALNSPPDYSKKSKAFIDDERDCPTI